MQVGVQRTRSRDLLMRVRPLASASIAITRVHYADVTGFALKRYWKSAAYTDRKCELTCLISYTASVNWLSQFRPTTAVNGGAPFKC